MGDQIAENINEECLTGLKLHFRVYGEETMLRKVWVSTEYDIGLICSPSSKALLRVHTEYGAVISGSFAGNE